MVRVKKIYEEIEIRYTMVNHHPKYIVITGGVISGIGKGVTASSIGVVMKMWGAEVTALKIDPYLNVDAGTMSPLEHGECFVLNDGSETDLDLGNYERFLHTNLKSDSNITTGKIYSRVIEKERRGDYLGKTVQIIPHITNEIIDNIERVSMDCTHDVYPDICIIELGGTIGDIESMPFVEALRQLQLKVGPSNFCLVHVSMIPTVGNETKTKPTQHSVKELRSLGLVPDFIVCRSELKLPDETREKIGLFCHLPTCRVLSLSNVENIYSVPMELMSQNMDVLLSEQLSILCFREKVPTKSSNDSKLCLCKNTNFIKNWTKFQHSRPNRNKQVVIGIVGKYLVQGDSYVSIQNSLHHTCVALDCTLKVVMIDSEKLECEDVQSVKDLCLCQGILVPGGFGNRGIEGKISAIKYARIHNIPFLGICLGMQLAVVEFSRNVLQLYGANSLEFDPSVKNTSKEIVTYMPEKSSFMGGSMRLGNHHIYIEPNTIAYDMYNTTVIQERHRHRYEINPKYVQDLTAYGLVFSGKDDSGLRSEIIELCTNKFEHPFFIGCQFHPEYKSRPFCPSPVFNRFVQKSLLIV